MAEVLVSTSDTPEQVAAALGGASATTETPVSTTTEVDHSIGAPFTVPDDTKTPDKTPAADDKTPAPEAKAEPTPAAEPAADTAKPALKPKHNDPQKRIDEITKKFRDAERQNADILARLQERERELMALRQPQTPPPANSAKPAAGTVDPNEPTEDQFETYTAFIEARADYRAEKKAAEIADRRLNEHLASERERLAREQANRTEMELAAAHAQRINDFKSRHADFDEVVGNSDVEVSLVMRDAIVQSPVGPDLTYYLGTHPDECARIAAMPPGKALMEMGRIEAILERQSAPVETAKAPVITDAPAAIPPLTSAPPPIRPITGGATTATADDSLPMHEWIRRQNALDRAAGRLG